MEAAAADARVPRAQWLPAFGATVQAFAGTVNNSTASYLGVPEVDLPRIGGTPAGASKSWKPSTSTLAAIGGGQEVFDFGRIAAQSAVADVAYETERHRADAERLRVDLLVRETYYGVHGARAILSAAEDAYQRAGIHRDMAAAGVKSGLQAPIELTRAEADLTRFDVGRVRGPPLAARARGRHTVTGLSLKNPIAILMICVGLVVFALVVTPRMSVDTFPELTPPVLVVGTLAPGLGPKDVEKTITQFKSLRLPFIMLFTIPVSLLGIVLALVAAGQGFSITALMGVLMVVGIAVSNGILLIDDANRRYNEGADKAEAVIAAARTRFIPIAMTSLATVIGLIPTALGLEAGTESNQPLALAIIGGLTSSTLLSLFLVPPVFLLIAKRSPLTEEAPRHAQRIEAHP